MKLLIVLVILSLISLINGHAVLVSPQPFSDNPSKTSPCGGGAVQTTNVLGRLCKNQVNTLIWKVVVGDGTGQVAVKLSSTNSASNFDTALQVTSTAPNSVTSFPISVNVPSTVKAGKYLLQIQSTSNWFSCSYVEVLDTCSGASNITSLVVKDTGSDTKFCQSKINQNVLVPAGTVIADLDTATKGVYINNMANPNVIGDNSSACGDLYKPILCDVTFPQNVGSDKKPVYQVTYQECTSFIKTCDVTSHKDLYPCDIYLEGNSASVVTISSLLLILILSIVLFI